MGVAVGFVGFGEAGYHIAKGLHGAGVITSYSIHYTKLYEKLSMAL